MSWYKGKLTKNIWAHLVRLGFAGSTVRLPIWPSPPKWPEEIVLEIHRLGLAGKKVYVPKVWRGFGENGWKALAEKGGEEIRKERTPTHHEGHTGPNKTDKKLSFLNNEPPIQEIPEWVLQAKELRELGYSLRAIGKEVGKSAEAVRKALKKFGFI